MAKHPSKTNNPVISRRLTLAEKIAEAMNIADIDHLVDDHPTSPSSVPGGRRRGKKANLGIIVNKTPFCSEH